jgi:hypothetical protein
MADIFALAPYMNGTSVANSAMSTANALGQLWQQHLANQAQTQKNQLMGQTLAGQIAAQNAQDQGITNTAVPMAQAKLGYQQAQIPYLNANTAHTQESTKLLPETTDISLANALAKQAAINQSVNRFNSPQNQTRWMLNSLGPQGRDYMVSQNAAPLSQMTTTTINQSNQKLQNPNPANSAVSDILNKYLPKSQKIQLSNTGQPQQPVISANYSSNMSAGLADAAQQGLIKGTIPGKIQDQRYYGATAGALYNQMLPYLPSLAKYAGAGGSFNQHLNSLQASLGVNNPDYQNMTKAKQSLNLLANETRRMLGGQATDKEMSMLNDITTGKIFNETPAQVLSVAQNMGDLINTTGKVLNQSPTQISANAGNEANAVPSTITVMGPNGDRYQIPGKNLAEAQNRGYRRVQ